MIKEIESFLAAVRGILFALKNERHFKFHFVFSIFVVTAGCYFNITGSQWSLILICIAMVTVAEILNSSIEKLTDIVSPGYNKQAGIVKDLAAGGVLITAIVAAIIGAVIFLPILLK
ncbi:MAG TPA: diacylglycerol kinase family protein [Bacteroidia bacterium]|nr:diacylglycerol kinase family protein [Bacteroidia bacterium]HNU32986.1 diacylglycerol kinase family protein [Bacteroidia bacterium]